MADISKINIDNTSYDIKDTQARNNIESVSTNLENYLPLSGGTMTGILNIKSTSIDSSVAPSTTQFFTMVRGLDENDVTNSSIRMSYSNNGNETLQLVVHRVVNGVDKYNNFSIGLDASGNPIFYTDNQSEFRNAINAVNKSGDTMTGNLYLNNTNMYFQKNGANSGQIYSSGGYQIVLRNIPAGSNYSEFFYTPVPNSDLTENKTYNILTTKNVVTTAQGGTGGNDSGWLSLPANSTVYTGTIRYRKIGKWVEVNLYQIKLVSELTSSAGIVLNTLPADYRPNYTASIMAGGAVGLGLLWITAAGNIQFFKLNSESSFPHNQNIYGTAMFFVE